MSRPKPDLSVADSAHDWLTTTEVASLLRVHPKHVYRLLHQGMPARRVGGQWRFSRDAIQHWSEQRGATTFASPLPSEPAACHASVSLAAIAPNEISSVVASVFSDVADNPVAFVHTTSKNAASLLASGEVVAAVLCRDDALELPCSTVRISLGSRRLGLLARSHEPFPDDPRSVAVPPMGQVLPGPLSTWLQFATARGVTVHRFDSDPEACGSVLRGESDVALSSFTWANRLGLQFQLVHAEPWELAIRVDSMEDPGVSRMCVEAQNDSMRERIAAAALCDPAQVGQMRLERGGASSPSQAPSSELSSSAAEPMRKNQRIVILLRDKVEQMLDLVERVQARGVRVGGFVQIPAGPPSPKPLAYDLYRLSTRERMHLAERIRHDHREPSGEHFCELSFHSSTLARACEWLREDLADADLLVIDGIGRMEASGQGLFPALAWTRTQATSKTIVLSLRRQHLDELEQRLALADSQLSVLSFDEEQEASAALVESLVQRCGKRRTRAKAGG